MRHTVGLLGQLSLCWTGIGVGRLFRLGGREGNLPEYSEPVRVLSGSEAWERPRALRTYICNIDFILVIFVTANFFV